MILDTASVLQFYHIKEDYIKEDFNGASKRMEEEGNTIKGIQYCKTIVTCGSLLHFDLFDYYMYESLQERIIKNEIKSNELQAKKKSMYLGVTS